MVGEAHFAELACLCSRVCYVLEAVISGRDVGGITGLCREIDDLEVESAVGEHSADRVTHSKNFLDHLPGFNNECIIAWKVGLCEILGFFDVNCHYLSHDYHTHSLRTTLGAVHTVQHCPVRCGSSARAEAR